MTPCCSNSYGVDYTSVILDQSKKHRHMIEILDWCSLYCRQDFRQDWNDDHLFLFQSVEDVILFKLTWC